MDPEAFLDLANQVVKLKMFPYFDVAHCALSALAVREDLGNGESIKYQRKIISCCKLNLVLSRADLTRHEWLTMSI